METEVVVSGSKWEMTKKTSWICSMSKKHRQKSFCWSAKNCINVETPSVRLGEPPVKRSSRIRHSQTSMATGFWFYGFLKKLFEICAVIYFQIWEDAIMYNVRGTVW